MSETPAPSFPSSERMSAGGRAISSAQLARVAMRLVTPSVMARMLTPDDYGLQGMAVLVWGTLYMARDFGIVTLTQQPGFSRAKFNACVRLALGGGLALAVACAALGWPVGIFFGEAARLPPVLGTMAGALLLASWAAPAQAWLLREQRVGTLAKIEVTALVLANVLAVLAALAGCGVWALVTFTLVNEAVLCVGAWRACEWKPTLARSRDDPPVGELLRFGAAMSGSNVATTVGQNLDQAVVGWSFGTRALGVYGRGAQLGTLPVLAGMAPFTGWIVASLAKLRERPEEFAEFFRRALGGLAHVAFAAAAVCVAAPEAVLRVLFGDQWLAAAPVVRWLGVGLAMQPWLLAKTWLLESTGQVRRLLAVSGTGLAMLVTACLALRSLGTVGVAAGVAIAAVLHAVLAMAVCTRSTPVGVKDWLRPLGRPLALHAGAAAVLAVVGLRWSGTMGSGVALAKLATGGLYYAVAWAALPAVRAEVRGLFFWSR